jgi:hypothetical protein
VEEKDTKEFILVEFSWALLIVKYKTEEYSHDEKFGTEEAGYIYFLLQFPCIMSIRLIYIFVTFELWQK